MRAEHLQGKTYYTPPKGYYMTFRKPIKPDEGFVIHWKGSGAIIRAKLVDAPPLCYKLYLTLTDDLEYPWGNVVLCDVKDIARRFSLSKAAVYEALAALKKADIVRRIKEGVMLIDPHLVWAGRISDQAGAVERWNSHDHSVYTDYMKRNGGFPHPSRLSVDTESQAQGNGVR